MVAVVISQSSFCTVDLTSLLDSEQQDSQETVKAQPNSSPNLSALLDSVQQNGKKTVNKVPDSLSEFSTLLDASMKDQTKKKHSRHNKEINQKNLNALFELVEKRQNNSNYQAAMKILNNAKLQKEYSSQLMTIQMSFMQYLDQVLDMYSSQAASQKKQVDLTALLQASDQEKSTQSDKPVSTNSLASLLESMQQKSDKKTGSKKSSSKKQGNQK